MLDKPTGDWRAERREAARAEILRVAGQLAREHGLAGLSLRDLARRLGMAAPSLYSYFESKNALYDAMFTEGWQTLLDLPQPDPDPDLRTSLRRSTHAYVRWALEDPVRYQLLNQRTIPGFEPSPEAYAVAQRAYEHMMAPLRALVDVTQEDLDLLTALVGGLINQQIANEPGGTRWVGLVDDAMDLYAQWLRARATTTPAA
ncbi:MAG TPA: TetR/AcrR family transcriptional regulator [Mycobacteriales bacterium]|nr:TetR/AcrR family transcriptional regulator [Mycobacteriales bacterium]